MGIIRWEEMGIASNSNGLEKHYQDLYPDTYQDIYIYMYISEYVYIRICIKRYINIYIYIISRYIKIIDGQKRI